MSRTQLPPHTSNLEGRWKRNDSIRNPASTPKPHGRCEEGTHSGSRLQAPEIPDMLSPTVIFFSEK